MLRSRKIIFFTFSLLYSLGTSFTVLADPPPSNCNDMNVYNCYGGLYDVFIYNGNDTSHAWAAYENVGLPIHTRSGGHCNHPDCDIKVVSNSSGVTVLWKKDYCGPLSLHGSIETKPTLLEGELCQTSYKAP